MTATVAGDAFAGLGGRHSGDHVAREHAMTRRIHREAALPPAIRPADDLRDRDRSPFGDLRAIADRERAGQDRHDDPADAAARALREVLR